LSVRGTHVPEHLRLPIAGVTPPPTEKDGQRLFPTGNFRFFRPVFRDKTPPCNHACPTGEKIQKYLDHVKHDRYLDGYLTILEDNPMPSVTGRVCYHPCESACNRAEHDEPIGIRGVERFLGDFGLNLAENPVKDGLPPLNGKTVAVVGSGPGGLACAYHLRRLGYASVIFEALDKPGGMLRAGIPAWHLPEEILDAEIGKLLDLGGIEIRCGVRVGDTGLTLDELAGRHDAVFLALGQDVGRRLDVEGAQARGVIGALEFLRETGLGRPVRIGTNVLVIGGGNTASDAARSAIRLGTGLGAESGGEPAQATIVSLEAAEELAIVAEDLAHAHDEGVLFRPRTALARVLADAEGNVRGAVLCQASLSRDENGAVTATIEEGTEFEVPCDTILVAIGQVQVLDWLPAECWPQQSAERGLISADEYGRLPHPSGLIFTGGDVMRGPSMVVDALGDGKRAARDIDRVLSAAHRGPGDSRGGAPGEPGHRGHPGLQPRPGAGRGGSLHVLRGLQRLRQLLHRVPRCQRDARHAGERPLRHPHALLQGLPGLRAGMPHRRAGAGARDGLRRTRRRGPDGDRLRALRRRARRAGPLHPPAHRGRDRGIRRRKNKTKINDTERAW
jgi:NADPH-dependent glutamate synthase beta subunit-like oxidoreductase